jgi:hypothetical protein
MPETARGLKRIRFPRSTYTNRGIRPAFDEIGESFIQKKCKVCESLFQRIHYKSGRNETWVRFNERMTCSKECKKALISGKGNPNFKGLLRFCLGCKKQLKGYTTKQRRSAGQNDPERCQDCWFKHAKENKIYSINHWVRVPRPSHENVSL